MQEDLIAVILQATMHAAIHARAHAHDNVEQRERERENVQDHGQPRKRRAWTMLTRPRFDETNVDK